MSFAIRMNFEPVRTLAFGGIGVGYEPVGTPLANAARQYLIQNLTDGLLMFSIDGVTDHFPVAPNAFFLSDITSNKQRTDGFLMAKDTQFYVRQITAPTVGSVYITIVYGTQGGNN